MNQINYSQFQKALSAARDLFTQIHKKYPDLRAYLVIAFRGEQTDLENNLIQSILEYPSIVLDGPAKSRTLELIKQLRHLNKPKPAESPASKKSRELKIKIIREEINLLLEDLELDGRIQVEIRFRNLVYDLVWKLQVDDLVDRNLTPQTRASIRIVLGTISQMLTRYESQSNRN